MYRMCTIATSTSLSVKVNRGGWAGGGVWAAARRAGGSGGQRSLVGILMSPSPECWRRTRNQRPAQSRVVDPGALGCGEGKGHPEQCGREWLHELKQQMLRLAAPETILRFAKSW